MRTISLIVLIAVQYSGVKAQTKLKPQSDGYIFLSGEKMNSNHGTGDTLITRYTKRGSTTAYTYIRFDLLKQARHFKKATFNIYGSTDSTKLIDVYAAFGNWKDTSLKGSTGSKPSRTHFIGSFAITAGLCIINLT